MTEYEEMNPSKTFPFEINLPHQGIELPYKMGLCDDPWIIKHKFPKTTGKLWFIIIYKSKHPNFKLNNWGVYLGDHNLPKKLKKCNGTQGRPDLNHIFIFQKDNLEYQGYPMPFMVDFN